MNLFTKQTSDIENNFMFTKREGWGGVDKLGVWD